MKIFIFFNFLLVFAFFTSSFADPIFRIDASTNQVISKFGYCKKITNASAKNIMVPTNTLPEWSAFLAHLPTSVTAGADGACSINNSLCTGGIGDPKLQSDGKIVVCELTRFNTDGTKDTSLNVGTAFNDKIKATLIQTDGKIVVAGIFTNYNGTAKNYIVRLNSDGSIDSGFNMGTGFDSYVFAMALQPDGKILVGGRFGNYNGTTVPPLVRLNTNGTLDTGFTSAAQPDDVKAIAVQSDGKILVGGDHPSPKSKDIERLTSTGAVDGTFNKGTSVNNIVNTIAQQSDGKIIIGGDFTTYNGATAKRLARLNTDGTLDTAFITAQGTGVANNSVLSVAIHTDGKIVAGGDFTSFNGSSQNRILRLDSTGAKDTTFVIGTGFNSDVEKVLIQPDGRVIAVGSFTAYNGIASGTISSYTIRLNIDGSL